MIEKLIVIALIKGALDQSVVEDSSNMDESKLELASILQIWGWKELGLELSLFDLLK